MLAILVACGAGYYLRPDLMAACGLSRRAAGMAFDDCFAAGLLEPEAMSPNYFSPTQAGIEALRDAQGAQA